LSEKYFQSHIIGESAPEALQRSGENHAAFCLIDGQMISGKAEGVFFGNSATTRIFPFLQHGHMRDVNAG
jgi:hypothetical protein